MIDLEHAPLTEADVMQAMVALEHAGGQLHLKMAGLNPETYARFLFFGVRSFFLPQIENAAGFCAVRDRLWRMSWIDPSSIRLCPMIESKTAIREVPVICAQEGVSAVQIGLVDLALDLGFPFRGFQHFSTLGRELLPHLLEALDQIRACGKSNGCMVLPEWFDFFPLARLDQVTVPFSELIRQDRFISQLGAEM